jgi:WD40 repeat protein
VPPFTGPPSPYTESGDEKIISLSIVLLSAHFAAQVSAQSKLGTKLIVQTGHSSFAMPVGFSPDGRIFISRSGSNKNIKLCDVATGRELRTLLENASGMAQLSPDGRTVAYAGKGELSGCPCEF